MIWLCNLEPNDLFKYKGKIYIVGYFYPEGFYTCMDKETGEFIEINVFTMVEPITAKIINFERKKTGNIKKRGKKT